MKYRVLKIGDLFYPQVKETRILKILFNPFWWFFWKKIGDNPALVDEWNLPYKNPFEETIKYGYKTEKEAYDIIELYKQSQIK